MAATHREMRRRLDGMEAELRIVEVRSDRAARTESRLEPVIEE